MTTVNHAPQKQDAVVARCFAAGQTINKFTEMFRCWLIIQLPMVGKISLASGVEVTTMLSLEYYSFKVAEHSFEVPMPNSP